MNKANKIIKITEQRKLSSMVKETSKGVGYSIREMITRLIQDANPGMSYNKAADEAEKKLKFLASYDWLEVGNAVFEKTFQGMERIKK